MKNALRYFMLPVILLIGCSNKGIDFRDINESNMLQALSDVQNKFICERRKPTAMRLSFFGNKKNGWIAVVLGRNGTDFAAIFMAQAINSGVVSIETKPFVLTKEGWKSLYALAKEELDIYGNKSNFSSDEKRFLARCLAPKLLI